jgi:hypothetical protein
MHDERNYLFLEKLVQLTAYDDPPYLARTGTDLVQLRIAPYATRRVLVDISVSTCD